MCVWEGVLTGGGADQKRIMNIFSIFHVAFNFPTFFPHPSPFGTGSDLAPPSSDHMTDWAVLKIGV